MTHDEAEQLLTTSIENQNRQYHCRMVATAMMAYAEKLNKEE
jgi:predicted hydrolase (HD superfamily)